MIEDGKKFLLIGFVSIALLIAGTVFYRTISGNSKTKVNAAASVALKCTECGGFEVTLDEFNDILSKGSGGMGFGPKIVDCPKCGKHTCYVAQKCQKCQNIFVSGEANDERFPDRCPKCGFSKVEDRFKN
jgi:hypothetical protein